MKLMIESVVGLTNDFHIHKVQTSNGLTSDVRELVLVDEGCIHPSFDSNVEPYSDIDPTLSQVDGDVYILYNQFGFFDPAFPDGQFFRSLMHTFYTIVPLVPIFECISENLFSTF